MCGRFTVSYTYEQMLEYLKTEYSIFDFDYQLPRYNIAPSQDVLSVISDGEKFRVGTFKWGYVPKYVPSSKLIPSLINAKGETIDQLVSFKESFHNRRCIIFSDGFYEWDHIPGSKQPYYFTFEDQRMRAYAGIWNKTMKNKKPVYTVAIITVSANRMLSDVHDRMPAILDEEAVKIWLDKNTDSETLKSLLTPYDYKKMKRIQVNKKVNNTNNDDPSLVNEYIEYTIL
jgi:putative SOS response-associated peptidase YedK